MLNIKKKILGKQFFNEINEQKVFCKTMTYNNILKL